MTRNDFAERTYRALVRLYPRGFREEYGVDMVALFRDQLRDEPLWRVSGRSFVDLCLTIPALQLEVRMNRNPRPVLTLLYMVVAVAGLLVAIVSGSTPVVGLVGGGTAVGGTALAVLAWRRGAPVRASNLTIHWWKLVLAGPVLVAAVIVGATLGVEAWYLGMALVFAAIGLVVVGLGLGFARLVSRRPRVAV